MTTAQHLQRHFPTFSPELIEEINSESHVMKVKQGQFLMEIGQEIEVVSLLIDGSIKVHREDEGGKELFLYYLYPGEACAISLVCSGGRDRISTIRATAEDDSTMIVIPVKFMDLWMQKHIDWYEFVLTTYRARVEELLKTIDEIAFHSMDERLLMYLDKNVSAHGTTSLKTSHQDIAYELNTSREVVSRLLKKLEHKGKVKLARNQIEVLY